MGSAFWAQPAKRLDRELRDLGARRVEKTPDWVAYRMPDDARVTVPKNIGPGAARAMFARLQRAYDGCSADPLRGATRRPGAPTIDLSRLVASKHAQIRFDLMRNQASLSYTEVLDALRIPERVLWSEPHDTWLWVRGRIAVAAGVDSTGAATIVTLLWTTQELWDANPRPVHA